MTFDTRSKIIGPASLPPPQDNIRVAKGWFDVLTSEHCELLRAAKPRDGALVVLVYRETDLRPAPLGGYDRAQMVAALEPVDWVCLCEASEAEAIAQALEADSVVDVDSAQRRNVVSDVLELHAKL